MKIAIVKLSALGDIIHAMVVLQFIKKHHPDALIDWVVEACFQGILANNPDIHQIHTVNLKQAKAKKSLRLAFKEFKKIRQFGAYDLVIDMQGLVKSAIIAKLIPSKQTWGFSKNSIREVFATKFYNHTVDVAYDKNIIKRNIAIISAALNINITNDDVANKKPFLYTKNQASFDFLSTTMPNVVLILGASFASKIYPVEKYAQITEQLKANFILVWGNDKEYQLAHELKKKSPMVHISQKCNLGELIDLIKNANLVIGGDTGPTHMPWALNIPSIALFGATPGSRNACQTKINKIIESKSKVNPYTINKNDDSIKTIPVSDIISAAKVLLKQRY